MFETTLDKPNVRIALALSLGVPVTLAGLIGAVYGALLVVAEIEEGNLLVASLCTGPVFAIAGICGAWRRLLHPLITLSVKERRAIRILLYCGLLGCAVSALFVGLGYLGRVDLSGKVLTALIAASLSLVGVVFIAGTPGAR